MSFVNDQKSKLRVGILGATGLVGQRFIALLEQHQWFEVKVVGASARSAGKKYAEAVEGRWAMSGAIPPHVAELPVLVVEKDMAIIASQVDFVFSAIDADKDVIAQLEAQYAAAGVPVVSNNSAHRWTADVPMIMPEVNPEHASMIRVQQERRGWTRGFIAVKPNCSLQSYVPLLKAWQLWQPERVMVATYQAVSGAGKTLASWPEMQDNVIPYIGGEEEKSEREPLKILSQIEGEQFVLPDELKISASCIRVPVSNGHMAAISVGFKIKPTKEELIMALREFKNPLAELQLPSAPDPFITYFEEDNRPQTRLDRDIGRGMGIAVGRLRPDSVLDFKCVALSHNTVRGAAGGAILVAELLKAKGYLYAFL